MYVEDCADCLTVPVLIRMTTRNRNDVLESEPFLVFSYSTAVASFPKCLVLEEKISLPPGEYNVAIVFQNQPISVAWIVK
jgi:hypothetical protein